MGGACEAGGCHDGLALSLTLMPDHSVHVVTQPELPTIVDEVFDLAKMRKSTTRGVGSLGPREHQPLHHQLC